MSGTLGFSVLVYSRKEPKLQFSCYFYINGDLSDVNHLYCKAFFRFLVQLLFKIHFFLLKIFSN